jgi:hypothetical protein
MIYDYIVIGSGFGGSVSALCLAEYCMSRIPEKDGTELSDISKQLIVLEEEWRRKR